MEGNRKVLLGRGVGSSAVGQLGGVFKPLTPRPSGLAPLSLSGWFQGTLNTESMVSPGLEKHGAIVTSFPGVPWLVCP